MAEKELQTAKTNLNYDLEGYRYSKAKAQAAKSKEERGEEVTQQAEASKKRLTSIMSMEQRRVDESMAIGKDRVMGKLRELEHAKKRSFAKLAKLKQEYAEWQGRGRAWASHIAATKDMTNAASRDYADARRSLVGAAED